MEQVKKSKVRFKSYQIALAFDILILLSIIPFVYNHFNDTANEVALDKALQQSELISRTLKEIRHLYTSEVINMIEKSGDMNITHDYWDKKYDTLGGAIPLPATFSMLLAEKISADGININLYSKYPFPLREDRVLSEFENEAWEHFLANPKSDKPYYKFIEDNNQLYYAIPDKMVNISCINCHNSHPKTPKNNWKLGDIRGVISITKPVQNVGLVVTANNKTSVLLGLIIICSLLITYFTFKMNKLSKNKIDDLLIKTKTQLTKTHKVKNLLYNRTDDLKLTLIKLKKTQHTLIQSEKMASLGVLTAGVAHEINNPINFISSGTHSLDNDFKDLLHILNKLKKIPKNEESLKERAENIRKLEEEFSLNELIQYIPQTIEDIKEGVNRTAEIIKGLLLYSRSDTSKLQKANIHESIDASLILLKDKFKDTIQIVKKYNLDIEDIECYPGQLSQVFTNLIDNAIDAINNKGTITITTTLKNKQVVISIQDTGEGISDPNLTKIFDPFFTTKEVGKGTGLGLSICQGIINNHKGSIEVKSKDKKGTEFIITLPINFKQKENGA